MDGFGRVVAVILAVVLLFLFPLKYLAYNQESILDNNIQSETNDFVENVMNDGCISINMYENFLDRLNQTEQIYDIEMIHSIPLEGYDEVSHREVLTNLEQVSTHESNSLDSCYQQNSNEGFTTLGVATKQYKLATLENTPLPGSFQQTATHVHTDACYNGTKHTHSAYGGSCYTYVSHTHTSSCYHTHTSSCYSNVTCGGSTSYNYTSSYATKDSWCSVCQRNVGYSSYTLKCNSCGSTYGTTAILACPHGVLPSTPSCTALVSKLTCTTSTSTPICGQSSYYSLACGKTEGYYYNGSTIVNPTCNQVVASITATVPTQTILQGNSIVTTATATYLDGHTGTVTCTNNYTNTIGTQTVTLTYTGLVGDAKTTATRTTSITVTTNPNQKSCTAGKGHPDYEGSLSVCPICKAINGITISSPIVNYTGSGQGLTVTSSTGAETKVYYNGSTMLPIAVGNYSASIYVVIDGQSWLAKTKTTTFTIKKVAISLDVYLSKSTICKGEEFPLNYLTAHYNDGSSCTTGIGYTLSGFKSNIIGTQNVTVSFDGASTVKTINVVSPIMKVCTAGKGHPNYSETFTECPICKAINGISVSNQIVYYTGSGQGLTVTSSTGAETKVYYNGSTMLPIAVGNYSASVCVVIDGRTWTAKNTTFTIKKVATSLDVHLSKSTIYKGQAFPIMYFTATYADGISNTTNTGYTLSGFDTNKIGTQNVTFSYDGASTVVTITVLPNVTGLTLTPSKSILYKGDTSPTFILTANYEDGTTANVTGSVINGFNPNTIGEQAIRYWYTENGITLTATCIVKILPNINGLTVIPSSTSVLNGNEPTYTIYREYEDGSSKIILPSDVTKTGFTSGAGTKNVTFTYTENNKTVSTTITIIVNRNTKTCIHGHTYELDNFDSDLGCSICKVTVSKIAVAPQYVTVEKGSNLPITVTATYLDGHTNVITSGWTSDFDNTKLGNQLVTIIYEGKSAYVSVTVEAEDRICPICNNTYKLNADGSDPGCPICSKTVVSITASPETQVVPIESSLDLEVTATYRDGHSEIVTGWTSNFNSFEPGSQIVTVYYKNVTTTVTVIVESPTETTCPICGTVYNPQQYVNGCPYCANTVDSIEARLRSGGNLVQLGSDMNIAVILIFKDGHRELAYNNYIVEGYEPNVLGNQTVMVKYNEFTTTLDIEVVNTLSKTVCENGHVYYLNADGSDPGCPLCSSAINQEETVKEYFNCVYTDEILEKLYTDEIYTFNSGDFITVNVSMKTKTLLNKLQSIFTDIDKPKQNYHFGGMILGPCI